MKTSNTIEMVSHELREQSHTKKGDLTLTPDLALTAIDELQSKGLAISSVSAVRWVTLTRPHGRIKRRLTSDGWASCHWQPGETWETYSIRSSQQLSAIVRRWQKNDPEGLILIAAQPPNDFMAKTNQILEMYFHEDRFFTVSENSTCIPLVAANVKRNGENYKVGQKVYIYDVFWGMNQRAKVVHRLRDSRKWVRGVYAVGKMSNFRPQLVHHPRIKYALLECMIDSGIFGRFWEMPANEYPPMILSFEMKRSISQ